MKVKKTLLKFISPAVDKSARLKAASGEFSPGEALSPEDELTVYFVLSRDRDPDVAAAAGKSLGAFPKKGLLDALAAKLDPLVIRAAVDAHADSDAVMTMAALNPAIDDDTLSMIAIRCDEDLVVALAEDEDLLLRRPKVLEALKNNPETPRSVHVALGALASRHARQAQRNVEVVDVPKDLMDEKGGARSDEHNIFKLTKEMSVSQKIKLALMGNKTAREFLVKDSNKLVSTAVLKNPRITDEEVHRLTTTKGTPEELLRLIGRNKEWLKNYNIKMGMVTNPKTPLTISIKLLDHLYDKDLDRLSKSKNIPSVLASSARRKVDMKVKK